jgi:hypothetical protein
VADEITLTLPDRPDYHRVAHLVLSGLAVRLELTIENLEDLQLALDAILDRAETADGAITVRMRLLASRLETTIGPLAAPILDEIDREADSELGLRRVLDSTVDDVHVDGDSVRLTKKVGARG